MSLTTTLLILAVTYLIGTLPTAWLVVRRDGGRDIRREGSGNVGAMNTLGVTGSKKVFAIVFLIDVLKGVVAVFAARYLTGEATHLVDALAILGVVMGHNFNIWMSIPSRRIEGGKGLASALGGLAVSELVLLVPVWILGFLIGFFLYKMIWGVGKIAPGTTLATLGIPLAAYLLYGETSLIIMGIVTVAIVIKHVGEMRELLAKQPAWSESETEA